MNGRTTTSNGREEKKEVRLRWIRDLVAEREHRTWRGTPGVNVGFEVTVLGSGSVNKALATLFAELEMIKPPRGTPRYCGVVIITLGERAFNVPSMWDDAQFT